MAVELTIQSDPQPDRKAEFKRVQAAKLVHRMASRTHKRWEHQRSDGTIRVQELHKYPQSRGRVLRHVGEQLERVSEIQVAYGLEEISGKKVSVEVDQNEIHRTMSA